MPNKPIKIVHVVPSIDYGGIAAFVLNYYRYMDRERFQIDALGISSPLAPKKTELEALGGKYYHVGVFSNTRLITNIVRWTRFFRKGQYDVVHSDCNLVGAWILLAARLAGVRTRIAHSHSTGLRHSGRWQGWYMQFRQWILRHCATLQLACSEEAGEAMYGKNGHWKVIPNGIDVQAFLQGDANGTAALRKEWHIEADQRVYTLVARISGVKNHDYAVDVFHAIHRLDPRAVLVIGGSGSEYDPTERNNKTGEQMLAKIQKYGLTDSVRVVGPQMDMRPIYGLTDCWLFVSLYEGFSISLLELQASKVPAVVSDRVTRLSDMGLGLTRFLSLDAPFEEWAEAAIQMQGRNVSDETIRNAFRQRDLDIAYNAKKLETVYES